MSFLHFQPVLAEVDFQQSIVGVVILLATLAYIFWMVKRDGLL